MARGAVPTGVPEEHEETEAGHVYLLDCGVQVLVRHDASAVEELPLDG